MSDVNALENRINAALGRIEAGLGNLADADSGAAGPDLQGKLEEEQAANAQLEERVKALKERQDTKIADLMEQVAAQKVQLGALDTEMQRLRASNADLRDVGAQLRAAATENVATPELINRAMMAEVEALTAQRASEAAEVDAVLSELKPLIAEA
jgi:peptidoglycan hydrolase CwlO-like protein